MNSNWMVEIDLRKIHEEKLRTYERVHKTWMETSIFNEEARTRVKAALDIAREEYLTAYQNAHPTHIVMGG